MKRNILFVAALFLSLSASGFDWGWENVGKDVQVAYVQRQLFNSTQSISILRYKASRHRTEIVNDPAELADSTSALALRHHGLGAINGSYFNVRELTPTTFVKDDGVQEGCTTREELMRVDGFVAVKGRHKICISPCDTASYKAMTRKYREVLASGPVLLQDGLPVRYEWPGESFFTRRHPRTLIGTSADGWVYFVVIDGRVKGKAAGATIPEVVQVAQLLGLREAINLDGGGSSTLWTKEKGVISHPTDNRRFDHAGQRTVPNAIIFR